MPTRNESDIDATLYADLAAEYYDKTAHPTCANFREGSLHVIEQLLDLTRTGRNCCELGAGRSATLELQVRRSGPPLALDSVLLVDSSPEMLRHSDQFLTTATARLLADARVLPCRPGSFDLFIISLGDPFNDNSLWSELARTIRPGGRIVFTTPAFEWAKHYRQIEGSTLDVARFVLHSGKRIDTPSHILDSDMQISLIERAGLEVLSTAGFPSSRLRGVVSTKIPPNTDIIVGYLATKPSS